jgi:flagellar biosynthesis GTPase FlhF
MASNVIDFADLSPELLADPVFADALEKNLSLIGNAGISFHINGLHFGVAMPNLFTPAYVSQDAFTISEVKPFQSLIPHLSYRYYFGNDKHVFEPYLVYRINQGLPSQLEAAGILHLNHKVWIGGTFKQDFGITALGGLKLSELLAVGGSYSLKNSGRNELNSPTYEIQLSYLAGNKKKNAEIYSFVSTVKEKERRLQRKSASEQIAERRRQEELARRKQQAEQAKQKEQEDLAAKKQDEQKKAAEEQARKQEEERKRAAESLVLQQKQQQQQQKATQEQVTPTTTPAVVQPPVKRHDGGPRLKSEVLSMGFPVYDTAHHQEQERLGKLSEHASDPDEVHGLDPTSHPNAERHEFVKRGVHPDELPVGDYVISGVFKSDANARHFAEGLKKMGFSADYGHLTERNLWYVYIAQTSDINEARMERDKYRQMKIFKDAWLLTVHH